MPFEIKLDELLVGYAAKDIKEGEEASLIVRSFISSDETDEFNKFVLAGIPQLLLSKIPRDSFESPVAIDEMVAILRKDLTASIYVDRVEGEIKKFGEPRAKKQFKKGDEIFADDIADIKRVKFEGIDFPPDAGVIVVFRLGNKRGYYFDLSPLDNEHDSPRQFAVEDILGNYATYLIQSELFDLDDSAWKCLFDSQWFPFILLTTHLRKRMIDEARNNRSPDVLLTEISEEVKGSAKEIVDRMSRHSLFENHSKLLSHGISRYLDGDFISTTSIMYPRLEGLLRSLHRSANLPGAPSQGTMADAAVEARRRDETGTLLLPERFRAYLKKVYFADFGKPNVKDIVSRHSVGHGVAPQEDFDLKSATVAILMLVT